MERDFLKYLEPRNLPEFAKGLCVGYAFSNLLHFLGLHLLPEQNFRSVRSEREEPSWVIPRPEHSFYTCAWPSGSQEYIRAFQNPDEHLITQLFLLSFWPASCVAQISSLPQAAAMLNNCHWLFSANASGGKAVSTEPVRSNKDKTSQWGFQETDTQAK